MSTTDGADIQELYRAGRMQASQAAWAEGVELRRSADHEVHALARVARAPGQQIGRPRLDASQVEGLQQQQQYVDCLLMSHLQHCYNTAHNSDAGAEAANTCRMCINGGASGSGRC